MKITIAKLRKFIREAFEPCPCGISRQDCDYHGDGQTSTQSNTMSLDKRIESEWFKLSGGLSPADVDEEEHANLVKQVAQNLGITIDEVYDVVMEYM